MTALGLFLVLLAVLVLLALVLGGDRAPAVLDLGLFDVDTTTMGIFLIGAATVLVFAAGLELLRSGLRRGHERRKELKHARAVVAKQDQRRDSEQPARTERHGETATGSDPVVERRTADEHQDPGAHEGDDSRRRI